jgi:hypothetical protein
MIPGEVADLLQHALQKLQQGIIIDVPMPPPVNCHLFPAAEEGGVEENMEELR